MQLVKDTERRGVVLERFYDARHKVDWLDFTELRTQVTINEIELANICKQLGEHWLIEWQSIDTLTGTVPMRGRITAHGIDVIEGTAPAPISITLHDNSVHVTDSKNVQIGNSNVQAFEIQRISAEIDKAEASPAEKHEAKSLLERLSNNALLASIIGALISAGIAAAR